MPAGPASHVEVWKLAAHVEVWKWEVGGERRRLHHARRPGVIYHMPDLIHRDPMYRCRSHRGPSGCSSARRVVVLSPNKNHHHINCAAKSVLFAVAFHARKCFGAATPSELYDCIKHRGHITMILNLLIEKVAYSRHGPTSA